MEMVTKYAATGFAGERGAIELAEQAKRQLTESLKEIGASQNMHVDGPRQGVFEKDPEIWGIVVYGDLEVKAT